MTYEEDHGMELFGTNLFEAANHDQKWIITTANHTDTEKHYEYLFTGTEFEAKRTAAAFGGTYRRAEHAAEE